MADQDTIDSRGMRAARTTRAGRARLGRGLAVAAALACLATAPVAAKKKGAWTVTRATDPITGRSVCTVSAMDRFAGLRFTRVGVPYAVVENSAEHGLLVGVSSGGKVRLPVGDILWRVDDRPHHVLKAIDNPARSGSTVPVSVLDGLDTPANTALVEAMKKQAALVSAMTATATMASGETARAMLREMLAGKGLIYRSASAVPDYGLPSSNMFAVGQETNKGDKPIPIDESFHRGLEQCGIEAGDGQ